MPILNLFHTVSILSDERHVHNITHKVDLWAGQHPKSLEAMHFVYSVMNSY